MKVFESSRVFRELLFQYSEEVQDREKYVVVKVFRSSNFLGKSFGSISVGRLQLDLQRSFTPTRTRLARSRLYLLYNSETWTRLRTKDSAVLSYEEDNSHRIVTIIFNSVITEGTTSNHTGISSVVDEVSALAPFEDPWDNRRIKQRPNPLNSAAISPKHCVYL